jgi:4-hydroxy-tetrahydrodipicolinate reductase
MDLGLPVVVGTTGWYDQLETTRERCRRMGAAVLYASNFSVGVHLFWHLVDEAAKLLHHYPAYRVGLHEIHHTAKLDAPSGTAITTAEKVMNHYPQIKKWKEGSSDDETLGIHSERIGQVPGTHELLFQSVHDIISIRHEALNRLGFAEGALQAALWLKGKQGFFSIDDWLKSRI